MENITEKEFNKKLNLYISQSKYEAGDFDLKNIEKKEELIPFNRYVGSNKGKRKKATNITPPKKKRKKK